MQATVRLVSKAEFEKYGSYLSELFDIILLTFIGLFEITVRSFIPSDMSEAKKYKKDEPEPIEIAESRVNGKGGHSDVQMEDFSAKRRKADASYRFVFFSIFIYAKLLHDLEIYSFI